MSRETELEVFAVRPVGCRAGKNLELNFTGGNSVVVTEISPDDPTTHLVRASTSFGVPFVPHRYAFFHCPDCPFDHGCKVEAPLFPVVFSNLTEAGRETLDLIALVETSV